MPWLTSCCCGFSVRSGTKAIAVLSLMYSVFGLLAVGTFNYGKEILYREHLEESRRPTGFQEIRKPPEIFMETPTDTDISIHKQIEMEKFKKMEELMTLYAVSVSITFLVSLALLLAVKMDKKWLLLPWIIWTALNLVISQAVVLYAPDRTTTTIPDLFTTAIVVYCMMCVISYYQKLNENPPGSRSGRSSAGSSYSNHVDAHDSARCVSFPTPHHPHSEDIVVNLPDSPPPYPSEDPPVYDPPPPYPGILSDEKLAVLREENEVESTPTTPAIETPNDVTLATTLTTATPPDQQTPGNQTTTTTAAQSHDQSAVVMSRDQSAVVMPRDQSADSVAARLSSNEQQPKEEVKTKDETKI